MKAAPLGGRQITMAEVELHATKESAWFVRNGKVRPMPAGPTHFLSYLS